MMRSLASLRLGAALATAVLPLRAADPLAAGFLQPPAIAKPWVYWYFMDGHLSREGMAADLLAMKEAGIGGGIFLEVNLGLPRGPVDFMSPQWQDLLAHSLREADRLGVQIALGSGPGWCGTGGPWIPPELAMQHLVASETNVAGPVHFSAPLRRPPPREPYFGEGTLTDTQKPQWREFYRDVAVLAFPTPAGTNLISDRDEQALYYREPYSSKPGVRPFLPEPARSSVLTQADCIDPAGMVDLSSKLSAEGRLTWSVPPGRWTIVRFGRTLTGQTTRPAPEPGLGFETDKFSRAALDAHYTAFLRKILLQAGAHTNANGGLTMLHFDSWEMGSQNWSPEFRTQFRQRRRYDPTPFLPAYLGRIVDRPEITARFLWDVRHTAQELVVENHVGYLAQLAHRNGLQLSVEPYDLNPAGDLTLGRVADVPQCEFWYRGFNTFYSVLEAASLGHTCGRPIVAAEAFTSDPGEDWTADPAALKPLGDWAFCAGVNRLDFHRFQAQAAEARRPGMTMGPYGVHWDRTQTWWGMVPAYHQYLARCQYLLQRGVTVADVCFLAPEGAPEVFQPPSSATDGSPPDHGGYNFDGCAPETLLERARVRDGRLLFPGGSTYQILVLPERQSMTPNLLRRVRNLVREGATVFGPPPRRSPSLEHFPQCDREVQALAREIWGECDGQTVLSHSLGRGRICWRQTSVRAGEQYGDYSAVTNLLGQMELPPDFVADAPLRFTHRRDGNAEIYFVANRTAAAVGANCQFRVAGRQPELFDPMTGNIRALPDFSESGGQTLVPLQFEPGQSVFVVFRHAITTQDRSVPNFRKLQPAGNLEGAWEVSFDPKWGGLEHVTWNSLEDWSQRPEAGIKYYSGTAVYRKAFDLPREVQSPEPGTPVFLDLGSVRNLARVELNGHDLGVLWCSPWRVEISKALQPGLNQLVIEVANLWPNRLIGDLSLPVEKRFTWTTLNPYKPDSPLLPSGLLGPVTFQVPRPAR